MSAILAMIVPQLVNVAAGFAATRIAKRFPVLWNLVRGVRWLKSDTPAPYVTVKDNLGNTKEFSAEAVAAMSDDEKRATGILPEKITEKA